MRILPKVAYILLQVWGKKFKITVVVLPPHHLAVQRLVPPENIFLENQSVLLAASQKVPLFRLWLFRYFEWIFRGDVQHENLVVISNRRWRLGNNREFFFLFKIKWEISRPYSTCITPRGYVLKETIGPIFFEDSRLYGLFKKGKIYTNSNFSGLEESSLCNTENNKFYRQYRWSWHSKTRFQGQGFFLWAWARHNEMQKGLNAVQPASRVREYT